MYAKIIFIFICYYTDLSVDDNELGLVIKSWVRLVVLKQNSISLHTAIQKARLGPMCLVQGSQDL